MIDGKLFDEARAAAVRNALPASLVLGIVQTESGFRPWAVNPEPRYRFLWDLKKRRAFRTPTAAEIASEFPPPDFTAPRGVDSDAEWWCQQMSWGLMQVMGAVARERGFAGDFLSELCEPAVGLEFGCRVLASNIKRWGSEQRAIAAYNAGSPRMGDPRVIDYLAKVAANRKAFA